MQKLYSINVTEKYLLSNVVLENSVDFRSPDIDILQKRIQKLKEIIVEQYFPESKQKWKEYSFNKEYPCFFQFIDEYGFYFELLVTEEKIGE